jgi:2-oxoacid:acceptor oxidoreductase gamma subunit (pyruvate/2-ketoisovalerate family)
MEAGTERELLMSGIGGQGIQLASQVVARAAIAEGREVQLFGSYGGMMRGGNTESTIVVADGPIEAPPTVSQTWSSILMHHDYVEPTLRRLRPGSVVLVNSSVYAASLDSSLYVVVELPATDIAVETGNIVAAAMVMIGAYAAVTRLVALESLVESVHEALPSYRQQHVELNTSALRAGYEAAPHDLAPAWTRVTV